MEMILQECEIKQPDAQAFITVEQVQHVLNAYSIVSCEMELREQMIIIVFEPNSEVENILLHGFGEVVTLVLKRPDPSSLVHQNDMDVRRTSDKKECWTTGCSVISGDKLLLADCNNRKLKVVNIDTHSVIVEMTVDDSPFDITVLPEAQATFTIPRKLQSLILVTAWRLSRARSKHVCRRLYSIVYHQDRPCVVCLGPYSLLVLYIQGNAQRDISLAQALDQKFFFVIYLALSQEEQTLYVSDINSSFVARLTLERKLNGVYKHDELVDPRLLIVLDNGSLLVCHRPPNFPRPETLLHSDQRRS